MILEARFGDDLLTKFCKFKQTPKVILLQEEATEIESIGFVECYTTPLKDDIYAVTIIGVKISMHIQIFISVKLFFFLREFNNLV